MSLNDHTLNDFRTGHGEALDHLFTQVIATPVQQGLVDPPLWVTRVSQHGVRVRAWAGASSFPSQSTLKRLHDEAKPHLDAIRKQNDPSLSAHQHAKRVADAGDREARLAEALKQLPTQRAAQEKAAQRSGWAETRETRISTTDPDPRKVPAR